MLCTVLPRAVRVASCPLHCALLRRAGGLASRQSRLTRQPKARHQNPAAGVAVPSHQRPLPSQRVNPGVSPHRVTDDHAERDAVLRRELAGLGVDAAALLANDALKFSSALKVYRSFVFPKSLRELAGAKMPQRAAVVAAQIAFLVRQHQAHHNEFLRNHDIALQERANTVKRVHPLVLVLDNLHSAHNVGSIFRTAETAAVERVLTCGTTPHPPNPKLLRGGVGAVEAVPTTHFGDVREAVAFVRSLGYPVFALETTSNAKLYTQAKFPPGGVGVVVGNEILGVHSDILAECDCVVNIPTFGFKNSLNVACATAVLSFEVVRQWGAQSPGGS